MISIYRSPKDTFFYFKTESGRLPGVLSGSWTTRELAEKQLAKYREGAQNKAEKNSAQVRKAKAKEEENARSNTATAN